MKPLAVLPWVLAAALPIGLAGRQAASCAPEGNVRFVCGLSAPEDLIVVPGNQWVVASAYAGSGGIHLINARDKTATLAYPTAAARERLNARTYDTCPGPPDAAEKAKFQTHGLHLRAGANSVHTLYAVHHGNRESVEVFELDVRGRSPVLTWIGCAIAPDPVGLNEVVALPDGGFAATNFLPRNTDPVGRGRMLAGENNGELWEWHTGAGWKMIPESAASGANGLEISRDGRSLYVAAWGSQSFFRLSRGQTPPKRDAIPLGFRADNVRWTSDGALLVAGQGGTGTTQDTRVVRINPDTLAVQEVLRHPNSPQYGAGTVAVQIGSEIWIGSFRGDRLAIFPAR